MPQQVVVLRTLGPSLCKSWAPDGSISDYDQARQFHWRREPVETIDDLHRLLLALNDQPRECIIRGAPVVGLRTTAPVLRNLDNFTDEEPSRLFLVDVDDWPLEHSDTNPMALPLPAIRDFIRERLPACFSDISFVWQLSGSCGHPSKAGQLRAHIWFLLAEGMHCTSAEAWVKKYAPGCDHTVMRAVQACYTAAPLVQPGAPADPYAHHRVGLERGMLDDVVVIPADMPVPTVETMMVRRADRATGMVDPRAKPGAIGALCRAYSPDDLPTLFPDQFERGRKPGRITWLQGGGSKEGIFVSTDGQHAGNTHASSPIGGRAVNLFDFVRAHAFGDRDADVDPDVIEFDITAAPSYRATLDWAYALPDVQEQLAPSTPEAAEAVAEVLEQVKDSEAERALASEASTEQRVANLDERIASAPSVLHLETKIARELAKSKTLRPSDRERIAIRMQRRTKELEGKAFPLAIVRGWLEPVKIDPDAAFPDLGQDGEVLGTIENLEVLCGRLGVAMRYDVIRKSQDILAPGAGYIRDQKDNASFGWLTSQAAKVKMPHNSNQLKLYVCEICARTPYNPALDWIESREWDGVSRIDALAATVTLRDGFDVALAKMILRKWLIQAVAAAASPVPLQTRGVLVFAGGQYLGKSRWVKALLPGHEDLAILGRQIDPHNKDSVKIAISHWIAELGELDATFKKSDVSALKAFLANDEDAFRLPYAPAESKFQRRTVFAGSVNGDDFLIDDTGNTRFWVLPVAEMDHTHKVDMQQVWAEMLHAWRAGEPHWFERDEMARVDRSNEAHVQLEPMALRVADAFAWAEAAAGDADVAWVWRTPLQVATRCGVNNPTRGDLSLMGRALGKRPGCYSKNSNSARRWWVPLRRAELELDELAEQDEFELDPMLQ